jgi:lipopolysaccharide assembly outer membrane protein LptD (OstA)
MKIVNRVFLFILLLLVSINGYTQDKDKVQLEEAAELIGEVRNGKEVRKIIGPARFRQNATLLYCDSAYLHQATDFIEAFGNVKIVEGDSVTVTGNNGTYDGRTRMARMYGNVVLTDRQMTLNTEQLDYNMKTSSAFYPNNGTIVDAKTPSQPPGLLRHQNKNLHF